MLQLSNLCSQIRPQQLTPRYSPQFRYRLILYLPYPFPCKIISFPNILQAQGMIYTNAKEIPDHFFLPFCKGAERAVYFLCEGIVKCNVHISAF